MKRTTTQEKTNPDNSNIDEVREEQQEEWRFFRSNLSTIVWDARPGKDRALADFSKGYFTTDDEYTVEILRKMGYPEIPLDMTEPPEIVVNQPAPTLKTGHVPVMRGASNISGEAAENAASKVMDKVVNVPEVQSQVVTD